MSNSLKFPIWFVVLTITVILSNLFVFGLFSLIHPELPWPELGTTDAAFPIQFFAIRHIAFGVILTHGLVKKNISVLTACYHMFFVISVLDIGLLALNENYYIPVLVRLIGKTTSMVSAAIATTLFLIPMLVSIKYLRNFKSNISSK